MSEISEVSKANKIELDNRKEELADHGIHFADAKAQLQELEKCNHYLELLAPCSLGNGITKCQEEDKKRWVKLFQDKQSDLVFEKFVPASGAASRMFKFMYEFLDEPAKDEEFNKFLNRTQDFAFFQLLPEVVKNQLKSPDAPDKIAFAKFLLSGNGMNFGAKPKALIPFHQTKDEISSPFLDHVREATIMFDEPVRLHFTISPEHQSKFVKEISNIHEKFEIPVEIKLSFQDSSSDTIAVDENFNLLTKRNGKLVFRPGGHGALIRNLNKLDSDIVFIKNIDNIAHPALMDDQIDSKSALAGMLIEYKTKIDSYLVQLEKGRNDELNKEIAAFMSEHFGFKLMPDDINAEFLFDLLNRPLRVCGVVKNEGKVGGGPFWVANNTGYPSAQIVEQSQIKLNDEIQEGIFKSSSHFNPVDLVCALKDHNGESFDLNKYIDHSAVIITEKSYKGKKIKVLERPGLWNGAMANWNTLFVEVPLYTFNPVKTMTDLLNPYHLGSTENA